MLRSTLLVVILLGTSSTALAQGASALGSPWGPGHGPRTTPTEPQDIDAEPSPRTAPATPPATPPPAAVGPGGVVVPDGYSGALGPAVIPEPGRYPGAPTLRVDLGDSLHLPSGIVTRIRALDADMQILAARGGGSVLDGVLALLSGGLSIAIGIILDPAVMGGSGGSFSPYLYTYGSGMIVRGILDLALMTNPGAAAATYAHMPLRSPAEVRERLRYGERELQHLAEMSAISRYVDGGLNVALGLLIIPVYVVPNGFDEENPFTYLVLLGAAISVTTGLIAIFTTSEAERRWGAYSELRDRLSATPDGADDDAELDELAGVADAADAARRAAEPSVTAGLGVGGVSFSASF